jgi:hypothetical protein
MHKSPRHRILNCPPGRALIAGLLLTLIPLTAIGDRDAESERYQAELQHLRIEGSMFDIQSRAFAAATPTKRAKMWADLETLKQELAGEEMQELLKIRAQVESPSYDAETLNYQATLQKAGKSAQDVHGLVTLFSISRPQIRQVLWDDLKAR